MAPTDRSNPSQLVAFFTRQWLDAEPTVSAFIFSSVRDFHAAEDLIQTVAVDAAAAIESYDRSRPFGPWIMGIARNRVLKHYRSVSSDALTFDAETLASIADAHESITDEIDDRRRSLRQCIEQLTDRARDVVKLRYEDDLPAAAIADRLGLNANAVYVTLHRARQTLADCIEGKLSEVDDD